MSWTICKSDEIRERALALAKGVYQRAIILGDEALSGSTLRGSAKTVSGGNYHRSRQNLLGRLRDAGIPVSETRGDHGKRILVLGE
jgi:hypothetical protein